MTLAEVVLQANSQFRLAGIEDARLEAELLLGHTLGITRSSLLARLHDHLPQPDRIAFAALLQRRVAHEPTSYIVGQREFYGLTLACTPAAIIPRPETEMLVEDAITWAERQRSGKRRVHIADVGSGSGAIAIAVAVHIRQARVIAIDASRQALALTLQNAESHGVGGRIDGVCGSMLTPARGPFDIIVANLPYIPTRTYKRLPPEIREHEPRQGLDAGRRGTAVIEELLVQAPDHLRPGGLLLAEHAWNQGRHLREAARTSFPTANIETRRDFAGRERMLVVQT